MERRMKSLPGTDALKKAVGQLRKYRWAALALLIGMVLLLWPDGEGRTSQPASVPASSGELTLEEKLCEALQAVDGAGRVEVVLTYETGAETIYQTQPTRSTGADGAVSEKEETLVIAQGGGAEAAVPTKTISPRCRGALIVCDGAGNAVVRLAIKEAVSCLTGLGTDRISVVKRRES